MGPLLGNILGLRLWAKVLGDLRPVVLHVEEERSQSTLGRIGISASRALALPLVTRGAVAQQTALIERVGDVAGEMREVEVG